LTARVYRAVSARRRLDCRGYRRIGMEILAPAGDMERLEMALTYGADAVYLAGKQFGMRASSGNFSPGELEKAVRMCHAGGVRVYVTVNTLPRNDEMEKLPEFFQRLEAIGADAAIIADVGVMALCRRYAPKLDIHMSTQTGVVNYETAAVLHEMGARRVVLARELTLEEIREIRSRTPETLELEAFGHGAMCVSFSGRCLLSNYLTGRDANRGQCAQPCRWKYCLVEEKRPGQYFEIAEDGGAFIMNSRDLCMIGHIPELLEAGISSLKIEGRMKSAYYTAAVTNAYRHALDSAVRGEPLDPVWIRETEMISHREYSTGFYFDKNGPGQHYGSAMYFSDAEVAAVVEACTADGCAVLTQRNKFSEGDRMDLLTPGAKPVSFTAGEIRNADGERIVSTPHPMMRFSMRLPAPAPRNSIVRRKKD